MAFKNVQSAFVNLAEGNADPTKIPERYGRFYDQAWEMYRKFSHFAGTKEIPHNDWPMICILADMLEKIALLEDIVGKAAGKAAEQPSRLTGRRSASAA
jgi:hypothetical protein